MQGGRDPFFGFGDPFGGFGGFGGFGRQRSLISEVFGGRDPFDDPFFRSPFGGAFESSFFGSNGGPFMNPLASGFLENQPQFPEHQPRFSEHQPPQPNLSRGPVIEELNSDDENDETGTINKENPRKHGRSSKEPIVVDPDDEATERKSKHVARWNDVNQMQQVQVQPRVNSYTFQSSSVSYGGANGAFYTSSGTRRTGSDGLTYEEFKEADSSTRQATHRVARGIHDKGHSVTRKLKSDGHVDTMQTLHNLNQDELPPVYSVDPAKRHAYAQSGDNVFTPVERELIFDIDISDYDDVRFCCSGADVCSACWPLMTVAIKIIDTALREDFGFNHILWVYSGRRGVHCWVCDGKARRLNNEQRAAITEYLHVHKGNENSLKKVTLAGLAFHPFLGRSAEVLKDFFEKYIASQNLFQDEDKYEKILELIPDESITAELRGKWQDKKRSREDVNVVRWGQLKHLLQSGKQKGLGIRRCVEEIIFSFTYPRLDIEVSKHMNHLLKAPFCIHPKTGHVCIPIDPKHCEDFDPADAPTLSRLLEELNTGALGSGGEEGLENTSLGKSIRYFRSSFLQPLLKSCKEEIESAYAAKVQQSKNSLSW